jgi:3-deoxy-D-manno-octulosonate 8-phosphate phosphatase (KDO 8-P phosphatase)
MKNFKELLAGVKAFIFDVDGVLTDGTVKLYPDGEMVRTLSVRDGYALQEAVKQGFKVGIITGAKSDALRGRLNDLGITDLYMDAQHKPDAFDAFLSTHQLQASEVMMMGDDLPDHEIMKRSGIPVCPADAAAEIRAISLYVSASKGGAGCARDVIEQVLKAQDKWFKA